MSFGKIYPFTYKQMISNYIEYDFDKESISFFRNELNIFFNKIKNFDEVRFWVTDYFSEMISVYVICNQFKNIKKAYLCNCDDVVDKYLEIFFTIINHLKRIKDNCLVCNLEELSEKGNQLILENTKLRIKGIFDIVFVDETYYDPLFQYFLDNGCNDCYDIETQFIKYLGENDFRFVNYYFFRKRISILKNRGS